MNVVNTTPYTVYVEDGMYHDVSELTTAFHTYHEAKNYALSIHEHTDYKVCIFYEDKRKYEKRLWQA